MAHARDYSGEAMDIDAFYPLAVGGELHASRKRDWPFQESIVVDGIGAEEPTYSSDHSTPSSSVADVRDTVCLLGSVLRVNAQLAQSYDHTLPEHPSTTLRDNDGSVVPLQVERSGDYLELFYDGFKLAKLNKDFCKDVCQLWSEHVELQAFLDLDQWSVLYNAWRSHSRPMVFEVEVNIYGPQLHAYKIGKSLAQAGIFLQEPLFNPTDHPYHNPQTIELPGFVPDVHRTELQQGRAADNLDTAQAAAAPRSRRRHQEVLDSVLNSLTHNEIQHELRAHDSRILKTELMPHQEKAIDFILQRESGNVNSELTMWKENTEDADETFYQHVLTGAKRPRREEVLGGIVADDMGLGKSLVVLYTVTTTSDRAKSFAESVDETRSSDRIASKATLILAPSTLLIDSWIEELRRHTYSGGLHFFKYLGPERYGARKALLKNDIVFTTYATVAKEKANPDSPLRKVDWFRLVLDEAHEIRNRSTRQYEAVQMIHAQHRWCLTGTPIQNTLEDLGSLVSFLRIPILENNPTFRKFIVNPTVPGHANGFQNLQTLLRTVCIRRTRQSIGLPDPKPKIYLVQMSSQERMAYQNLWDNFRRDIQMAVSGRKAQVSSTALRCIHELRLFCNNGVRTKPTTDQAELDDERLSLMEQAGRNRCAKCESPVSSVDREDEGNGGRFMPSCAHLVCHNCLPEMDLAASTCEFCEKQPFLIDDQPIYHSEQVEKPSKLQALLNDIAQDPGRKCIVFSSWKKTLDIAATMLQARGLRYDMIHGGLTLRKRINVLQGFKSPTGPNILLMTLGTGAVGLNLAVASRIYLLEPQWNPFLELQAMARALRIGQDHQVTIIRFIMEKTIEQSNVLNRQQTKAKLAGGGFKLKDSLSYFQIALGDDHSSESDEESNSFSEDDNP